MPSKIWCLLEIKSVFCFFCNFLVVLCQPVNLESECLHLPAINLLYLIQYVQIFSL